MFSVQTVERDEALKSITWRALNSAGMDVGGLGRVIGSCWVSLIMKTLSQRSKEQHCFRVLTALAFSMLSIEVDRLVGVDLGWDGCGWPRTGYWVLRDWVSLITKTLSVINRTNEPEFKSDYARYIPYNNNWQPYDAAVQVIPNVIDKHYARYFTTLVVNRTPVIASRLEGTLEVPSLFRYSNFVRLGHPAVLLNDDDVSMGLVLCGRVMPVNGFEEK
ncbi:hypothetical protein BJ138DRAFT_1098021 [Hygrophoropsis aurantiaca]|uniref:Uncharacterized protein n=1 Tax=Hygrophoropsis aurantiaca TaxID=72124 RepID=A0ACB8AP97_9AGAM|nr:hypothetical protein BJ138DRAFT_1098021 [Hygrophoropsis aurantiaca]